MTNMLKLEEFLQLTPTEREQYVLEKMKLEDFWVLGTVRNRKDDKPFFFVEELINPYTTKKLNTFFVTDRVMQSSAFCNLSADMTPFEDGAFVAAKVKLNTDEKKLKDRKIFTTSFKDIHEIESPERIQQLIEKSGVQLPIFALAKPRYQAHANEDFIEITQVVKLVAEEMKEAITVHEEQERAKTADQFAQIVTDQEALAQEKVALEALQEQVKAEKGAIAKELQLLTKLGFAIDGVQDGQTSPQLPQLPLPNKGSELVKGIQQQLAVRGYRYEESLVRQLLMSLFTGQMVVLTGPSGTGKTTIVRQLADVLGASCEIIPVQPSWTDKQDLLGFYNPIRKLFVPTAFLDCLVKAKEQPDKLFFICLDEMNLAQIEYYLADILSIREVPNEQLRLYSDFEYEQNLAEIRWFVQHLLKTEASFEEAMAVEAHSMQHFEMTARYKNMQRYQAQVSIPENIRIIGTMNVDGSVQTISPKIIDRAFIIPVLKQDTKIKAEGERGYYNVDFALQQELPTISTKLRSDLNKAYEKLAALSITYNDRVEKHVQQYYALSARFDLTTKQLMDDLALMKLYPRIHSMLKDQEVTQFVTKMNEQLGQESTASKKLTYMQKRMQETGLFSYWS